MKYINAFGVEVETSILKKPPKKTRRYTWDEVARLLRAKIPYAERVVRDGSIKKVKQHAMEIVSCPLKDMKSFNSFINKLYQYVDKKEINNSMGYHIHLSFKKDVYAVMIFSKEFFKEFKEELLKKFPEMKQRFSKHHCKENKDTYFSNDRYRTPSIDPDRYRAVNYIAAWGEHRTIEFRIFKANVKEKIKEYTKFLIKFVESYIEEKNLVIESSKKLNTNDIRKIKIQV